MAVGRPNRRPPDPPRVGGPVGVWLSNGKPVTPPTPDARDPRAVRRRIQPAEGMDPWRRWRLLVTCPTHNTRKVWYFHEETVCDAYRLVALRHLCAWAGCPPAGGR